jgi:NDP-sugar pyrophosphorylase family protein
MMCAQTVDTAVILAGGAGLRLRPLTDDRPKAMIEIAGRPLLEWALMGLKKNGIRHVIIGVAYKGERIVNHFQDGRRLGLNIQYSRHTVEGGTGEGFRLAIERHVKSETFFAMNGDELTNVQLQDMLKFHQRQRATATIAVVPLRSPFGVVEINGCDIVAFHEKATIDSVSVSVGVYVFEREILSYMPKTGDVEKTAFPRLAKERRLKAYRHKGFWMTVNTLKDLGSVEEEIKRGVFG